MKPCILAALIALSPLAAPAAAQYYKWVDEHGVTHYSQTPPPDHSFAKLRPAPPPPTDPAQARQKIRALQERLDAEQNARSQKTEEEKAAAEAQARRDAFCKQAREQLKLYTNHPGPRLLVSNSDGSRRRLTEQERQARLKKTQDAINQHCPEAP